MFVFRFRCVLLALTILAASGVLATAQDTPAPSSDAALRGVIDSLVEAFNKHDAQAVGNFWKQDATHESKSTSTQTLGREAIAKSYEELFKADPECKLAIETKGLRMVTPGVASLECTAEVRHTNGDVSKSEFHAIVVEHEGAWLFDQVHESDVPASSSETNLGRLDSLVGTWVEESNGSTVVNDFRWNAAHSFLTRKYRQANGDSVIRQGVQIIGWDAEHNCIRSWLFDGDGTFGEGFILQEGPKKWVNKLVVKLPDGGRGSLTQVIERTDDGALKLQTTDREIDGQALPNSDPVTFKLQAAESTTTEK